MSDPTRELRSAVVIDDSRAVKKLLAAGADPNSGDLLGLANLAIAKLLLAAGADVNEVHEDSTPLMRAVSAEKKDKVQLFLEHGADVNLTTNRNALAVAARSGNLKIVEMLLNAGADPTIRMKVTEKPYGDWAGKDCFDLAKQYEKTKVLALLEAHVGGKAAPMHAKPKSKQKYLGQGHALIPGLAIEDWSVAAPTEWRSAILGKEIGNMSDLGNELFRAVLRQNKREVQKLLAQGADPNVTEALGMATFEISELLLAAKADANLVYEGGSTPLSMAAGARDKKKVELLLKHGANVNLATDGNALIEAVRCSYDGKLQMVEQLLDAGSDPNLVVRKGTWKGKSCVDLAKEWKVEKVVALFESRAGGKATPKGAKEKHVGGKAAPKPAKSKAATKPATIPSTWERIEAEIKRLKWTKSRKLNKGASATSLAKVEKTLGVKLPDEFRESYARHDGQDSGTPFLLGPSDEGYCLLPLAQVLKEAKIWADLIDDFADEDVSADKGIRADWWNTKWLPIAGNGGGDFLCLDLAPAKGGQLGQIITMNHESPTRELWAKSFGEWLHSVAEQLKDVEA